VIPVLGQIFVADLGIGKINARVVAAEVGTRIKGARFRWPA
jgi:hypothetical protein